MGYQSSPFAGPQLDFSALSESIGSIPQKLRERELRQAFEAGAFRNKDGSTNYPAMVQALGSAGLTKEALQADNNGAASQDKYGLNPVPVWNQNLNGGKGGYEMYQPYSGGGQRKMDFGGGTPAIGTVMKETAEGLRPFPTKMPYGGTDSGYPSVQTAPQPQGVGVNLTPPMFAPGGQQAPQQAPAPQAGPAAIPTPASNKANHELAEGKAAAYAITADTHLKYDQAKKVIDETLANDEGVTNLTGNYHDPVTGSDTGIPSKLLYNLRGSTRNASANLESVKTQIGLLALAGMRAASAQGASGMGQLAIQESLWLQQSIESLDEIQDKTQFTKHMRDIQTHADKLKEILDGKYEQTYGEKFVGPNYPEPVQPNAPQATVGPAGATDDSVFEAPNGAKVRLKR